MNNFNKLPAELREYIYNLLSFKDLINLHSTSSLFFKDALLMAKIESISRIKQKSYYLTQDDCLYLLTSGIVCGVGNNTTGKLGLGVLSFAKEPVIIYSLQNQNVVKIAMGACHSVFLNSSGQVFVCGKNDKGQLGLSCNHQLLVVPSKLNLTFKVTHVCANLDYTLLKDEQGKIYFSGSNAYDHVSLKENIISQFTEIPIDSFACHEFDSLSLETMPTNEFLYNILPKSIQENMKKNSILI